MKIACITPDSKHDYLVSTVLEGLIELDVDLVVSDPGNGIVEKALTDDEFVAQASGCDGVIAFFGKVRDNRPPRWHLLDRLNLPRERMIYVDGSEWSATGWEAAGQAKASLTDPTARRGTPWINSEMLQKCGHYFKRETYPEDLALGVRPLPFALRKHHILDVTLQDLWDGKKDVDVFCSFGHVKTGLRKEAIDVVTRFRDQMAGRANIIVRNDLPRDNYLDVLARSRVVIDCWGGGDTCDRFWEAIGAKAVVLYQQYNVILPNPFAEWEQAVSFTTPSDLSAKLHRLVYGGNAETIGVQGFAHALRFHTARHRAEEIVRALAG